MNRIFKLYLLLSIPFALVYTQNLGAYLGTPPSSSITTKRGDFSFNMNYTTFYSFNQNSDISHYKRLAINIPIGGKKNWDMFELAIGSTIGEENNYSEMVGLSYNYKKRKFGLSMHLSSHNITIDDNLLYSPTEYGISTHFRFRTKDIKPFFYYSYTQFKDNDVDPYHTLIFGALSRINNISIGTHLVSSLEDLVGGKAHYSYLAITIGFVID